MQDPEHFRLVNGYGHTPDHAEKLLIPPKLFLDLPLVTIPSYGTLPFKNMRFLLPLFFLLTSFPLRAQPISDTLYTLGFVAKRGLPGHAFVVWEKKAIGASKTHQVAAFGLYPKSRIHAAFSVFSSVAGFLKPEWKQPNDSASTRLKMLRIPVTQAQFEAALQIRDNWVREGRYRLFVHDCVTFMYTVAQEVGLNVPERLLVTYSPIRYWHKFRFLYQRQTGNS